MLEPMRQPPNLLVLAYFYPPAATGIRRLESLLKHLPSHGWRPLVVCCRETIGSGLDESPLRKTWIAQTPVHRTGSLDPYRIAAMLRKGNRTDHNETAQASGGGTGKRLMNLARRHILLPDDRTGWIPFAAVEAIQLAGRHSFRAVYSSNYPQSTHVAAMIVSSVTGLPWLADFRDGWTQNPAFHDPGNMLMKQGQTLLESLTARRAARVVTVSPPVTRHLQKLRPARLAPAETIYNGFEPSDYRLAAVRSMASLHPGRLTLLYTGTFFGRRSPRPLFAALRELLTRRPHWRRHLTVRMRTSLEPRHLQLLCDWSLDDIVRVMPPVSFEQSQEEQQRADACLLILEEGPGAEIMVSQKIFEYLAARKPIFAMVPAGAAAELLKETGGASISISENPGSAGARLGRFLSDVRANRFETVPEDRLERFERSRQAARIGQILSEMTS